jgi:hypothetical protein
MKTFIALILTMLIAFPSFAEVKLYRYVDKVTNKEAGICYSDKDGNPINNPNWDAYEIQESEKQTYIDKQHQEQEAEKFSFPILLSSINQKFTGLKAIQLAPYLGAIEGYCNVKNWAGLRAFADGMIAGDLLTQDDYKLFNSAMKEQGVDLDDYDV